MSHYRTWINTILCTTMSIVDPFQALGNWSVGHVFEPRLLSKIPFCSRGCCFKADSCFLGYVKKLIISLCLPSIYFFFFFFFYTFLESITEASTIHRIQLPREPLLCQGILYHFSRLLSSPHSSLVVAVCKWYNKLLISHTLFICLPSEFWLNL